MNPTRDIDIRSALYATELRQYSEDNESRVLDEFGIENGRVRIDVAVVNGVFHGFEIKSDADTLLRLPNQARVYGLVFDYLWIACGEKHLREVIASVPTYWGILVALRNRDSGYVEIQKHRAAELNMHSSPESIARLLWRAEALELLMLFKEDRGLHGKPRSFLCKRLAQAIGKDELSQHVRSIIKKRGNWRVDQP
ncbi:MAG TPA: sce7726 family protein [Spirochaetia bacterium]|nr:sce7726 family protein [Spirochaetia bacterium]